jgi:hypothetical protein
MDRWQRVLTMVLNFAIVAVSVRSLRGSVGVCQAQSGGSAACPQRNAHVFSYTQIQHLTTAIVVNDRVKHPESLNGGPTIRSWAPVVARKKISRRIFAPLLIDCY